MGSAPDFKRNFQAAEDEKKTLNRLLRMAIEQKLALTQRLEDAEFEIESLRQYESQASSQTKKTRNHSSRSLRNWSAYLHHCDVVSCTLYIFWHSFTYFYFKLISSLKRTRVRTTVSLNLYPSMPKTYIDMASSTNMPLR